MNRFMWSCFVLCVTVTPVGKASAATAYEIHNLGNLPHLSATYANAMNNVGQVVGEANGALGRHAFLWDAAQGIRDLGTLGGTGSSALGINDLGQVVGYAYTANDSEPHRFLWDAIDGMQDMGRGSARGINNEGEIIEWSCVWDSAGIKIELGTLPGYTYQTCANAINNNAQVVGLCSKSGGGLHAFIWDRVNGMQDLSLIMGLGGVDAVATDINDMGQVVGYARFPGSSDYHAFLWDRTSGVQDLGTLGLYSYATGINRNGEVVGYTYVRIGTGFVDRAFVWDDVNGMRDLGTLGGNWGHASAINDSGHVVGFSLSNFGTFTAALWTPIPEPSTILALLCGLGGLGAFARRRRRH
ncbi:MAG: hypothetical protein A2Z18_10935 [Armatimonadetes bacterium RBG_16_58_9]|nr:MAG: hypothetical protein A2Z18_10935 [Armatimonadetes bacterium RBG_16_58_9]